VVVVVGVGVEGSCVVVSEGSDLLSFNQHSEIIFFFLLKKRAIKNRSMSAIKGSRRGLV
jgi:hypothetical protein